MEEVRSVECRDSVLYGVQLDWSARDRRSRSGQVGTRPERVVRRAGENRRWTGVDGEEDRVGLEMAEVGDDVGRAGLAIDGVGGGAGRVGMAIDKVVGEVDRGGLEI